MDSKNYLNKKASDLTIEEIEVLLTHYQTRCEKQRERYHETVKETQCQCGKRVIDIEKHKLTSYHLRRMEKINKTS